MARAAVAAVVVEREVASVGVGVRVEVAVGSGASGAASGGSSAGSEGAGADGSGPALAGLRRVPEGCCDTDRSAGQRSRRGVSGARACELRV